MAIDIVELRALGFADNGRKSSGPLHHPVHRDAGEQRLFAAFVNGLRFRAFVDEALLLALHEGLQAGAIESRHGFWWVWKRRDYQNRRDGGLSSWRLDRRCLRSLALRWD